MPPSEPSADTDGASPAFDANQPLLLHVQHVPEQAGIAARRGARGQRYVVSASKRTDIPAFYLPWFARQVEQGWVSVPNPMFRHHPDPKKREYSVSLEPADVAGIVWWSKNYDVYLRDRFFPVFERYQKQYFHFTINSRRPDLAWLEPDVPSEVAAVNQIARLIDKRREPSWIAWRNDPICFWWRNGQPESSWDPEFFDRMCGTLSAMDIRSVFVSVADRMRKFELRIRRHFPGVELRDPDRNELDTMAAEMARIASLRGMVLQSCAEPLLEGKHGIAHGACIDHRFFASSRSAASDTKMKGREACGCSLHRDIGDYVSQECGYSCVYCYANPNHRRYDRFQGDS
jgi:hypothetical protein